MANYRYLGYGITDENGIAKLDHDSNGDPITHSYTGTGAGEIDVVASLDDDTEISDSSIQSETYALLDAMFYDSGVNGSTASWTVQSALTKILGEEYATISGTNTGSSTGQMLSNPTFTGDFTITLQTNITYGNDWGFYVGLKGTGYTNVKLGVSGWRYIKITRISGVYSFKISTDNETWSDMTLQGNNAGTGAVQLQMYLANSTSTEHNFQYKDIRVYPI